MEKRMSDLYLLAHSASMLSEPYAKDYKNNFFLKHGNKRWSFSYFDFEAEELVVTYKIPNLYWPHLNNLYLPFYTETFKVTVAGNR